MRPLACVAWVLVLMAMGGARVAAGGQVDQPPGPQEAAYAAAASEALPAGAESRPADHDRFGFRSRGGRMHGPGERPGPPDREWLTPEQIDRLMSFAKENFPQLHERLLAYQQNNPALFQRKINQAAHFMFWLMRVKTENPELAKKIIAEHKSQMLIDDLTQEYRSTTDPSRREELREQLRKQVQAQFDLRLDRLRTEIKNLQRRLDQARQELQEQEKDREKLVNERLADLTTSEKAP